MTHLVSLYLNINQESLDGNSTDINKQDFQFMRCKPQRSIITCFNAPFSIVLPKIY